MRLIISIAFSLITAASPVQLWAPSHHTPEPTIRELVIDSAKRHGVPVRLALHRAQAESNFTDAISRNREGFFDVGPLQINSHWHPEVFGMELLDRIDAGMEILADWRERCGGDEKCAERAYRLGHL